MPRLVAGQKKSRLCSTFFSLNIDRDRSETSHLYFVKCLMPGCLSCLGAAISGLQKLLVSVDWLSKYRVIGTLWAPSR